MSDGKNSLIERLVHARHFAYVNSFNPHNSPMRVNLILQMRKLRHREALGMLGACWGLGANVRKACFPSLQAYLRHESPVLTT